MTTSELPIETAVYMVATKARPIQHWRTQGLLTPAYRELGAKGWADEDLGYRYTKASIEAARIAMTVSPNEGISVLPERIQELARLIGPEFNRVLQAAPPENLVELVVQNSAPNQLEELAIEALQGRLDWDSRFAEAGAPTPEEYALSIPETDQA